MLDKRTVSLLYDKKELSASEIAKKYNISVWRVISFMRRNKIKRRRFFETRKLQFERKPLTYRMKINLSQKERELWYSGLSLYWAEGSKANKFSVDFANSDIDALLVFIKMLRDVYKVDESKFRIFLYTHPTGNLTTLIDFWSTKLKVPKEQFSKPYIRKDFDINKAGKMPKGLAHIRYFDKKLLKQILSDIGIMITGLHN